MQTEFERFEAILTEMQLLSHGVFFLINVRDETRTLNDSVKMNPINE